MKAILLSLMIMATVVAPALARPADIENIQWTLIYADGREVTSGLAYIEIGSDGKFTGSTGCNRMFGSATVSAQRINFSGIGSTKKMCKLHAGSVGEPVFLDAMVKAARYQVDGNNLQIYDRRGRLLMRFRRVVKQAPVEPPTSPGPIALDTRRWVLESIKNRRTFAPIKGAFLNFDAAKRSAGGDSGCNVFGGNYAVNGSRIRITNVVSTMRACIEDGRMAIEREFLEGLRTANRFEIKEDRLRLYRGQNLLLTLRAEPKG